jgi:hypothetical protein
MNLLHHQGHSPFVRGAVSSSLATSVISSFPSLFFRLCFHFLLFFQLWVGDCQLAEQGQRTGMELNSL